MNKLLLSLLIMLFVVGCATTATSTSDNSGLPEIAAVDEVAYDPLPDVISSDFDGLTTEVDAVPDSAPAQ